MYGIQRKTVILICKFLFWIRILFAPPTLLLVYKTVVFKIFLKCIFTDKTRLSVSGHGRLTWIRFQLQWKMKFQKGGRYRRSEVEGLPTTPVILCVVVSRSYVTLSVSRSYVIRLFEVDTDFKNVFTLKNSAVCVRTWTVNVNTFSTTVKDEILEGQ